jgi:hypothetical protein
MNLRNWLLIISSSLLLYACHKRATQATPQTAVPEVNKVDTFDEMSEEGPEPTRILGRLISRFPDQSYAGTQHPCAHEDCVGEIEVLRIAYFGNAYHGQFAEGDIIAVRFKLTLAETTHLYPNLDVTLPGLAVNNIFEADLFLDENNTEMPYSIDLYNLIE